MNVKTELKNYRNKLKNFAKYGVEIVPNVEIKNIPTLFKRFQKTNDFWAKIIFPAEKNITACVYRFAGKGAFPWHHHNECGKLILVNEGVVSIQLTTMQNESETIILNQYESFYIPKGLGHCVASLKENTEIFLMWNPAFNFD